MNMNNNHNNTVSTFIKFQHCFSLKSKILEFELFSCISSYKYTKILSEICACHEMNPSLSSFKNLLPFHFLSCSCCFTIKAPALPTSKQQHTQVVFIVTRSKTHLSTR